MKFDSRKIETSTQEEAINRDRKKLRREESCPSSQVPAGSMLGPDWIGADGNIIMVDADGLLIAKDGCEAQSKDKKTQRVFFVSQQIINYDVRSVIEGA